MKRSILTLAGLGAGALIATSASANTNTILNVSQVADIEPSIAQTTYPANPFSSINQYLPGSLALGGYTSAQISGGVHIEPQEFMFAAFDAIADGNLHVGPLAYDVQPQLQASVGYSVISVNGYTATVQFYDPRNGGMWEPVWSAQSPNPISFGNADNPSMAAPVEDFDIPDVLAAAGLGNWSIPNPFGSDNINATASLSGHVKVFVGATADPLNGVKAAVLALPTYGLTVTTAAGVNPSASIVAEVLPSGTSLSASGQVAPNLQTTKQGSSWQLCAQYSANVNAPGVMYSDVTITDKTGLGTLGGDLANFPGIDLSKQAGNQACVPMLSAPPGPGPVVVPPTGCQVTYGCGSNPSSISGCTAPAKETFDVWGWAGSTTPPAVADISPSSPFNLLYTELSSTTGQALYTGGFHQEYFVCPHGATNVAQCSALMSGSPSSTCSTGGGGHHNGCGGQTCQ